MRIFLMLILLLFYSQAFAKTVEIPGGFTVIPIQGEEFTVTSITINDKDTSLVHFVTESGIRHTMRVEDIKNQEDMQRILKLDSIPEEKKGLYAEKMRESQRIDKEIKAREKNLQKELEEMKREYNKLN